MKMSHQLLPALAVAATVACASTPPPAAMSVVEADEAGVEGCEFLGTVLGKSGFGGLRPERARKGAMNSVRKRAAELGATHVVLGHLEVAGGSVAPEVSTLQARAYRCP